jgi:hypothetical protein
MQRDRGLYLGRMAFSHARTGDADAAVAIGKTALSIARETRSARILDELRPLRQILCRPRATASARAFATELKQTITIATSSRTQNGSATV